MTTSTLGCIARLAASLALAVHAQPSTLLPVASPTSAPPRIDASTTDALTADVPAPPASPLRSSRSAETPSPPNTPRPLAPACRWDASSPIDRTLRWYHWGETRSVTELARNRALSPVAMTLRSREDHLRVPRPLAPGVWFWRVRHLQHVEGWNPSPVWYFVVRPRAGATDTSWVRLARV
ncbi:MAG: hypothetical protein R3A52_01715 [Polyangiales bacterium]